MNESYLPEPMEMNREGYLVGENYRQCTHCMQIFEKTSKTVTLCPGCNNKRVKEQTPEVRMYRRAKSRAKSKGLEFSITKEDIVIPATCPILKCPLVVHKGQSGAFPDSPSLDRIDSSKGYTPDNIWVISQRANAMKSNATQEELKLFADWIQDQTG
jgi:DNA-directed RNA polymerase subunit RPC12/RpoP